MRYIFNSQTYDESPLRNFVLQEFAPSVHTIQSDYNRLLRILAGSPRVLETAAALTRGTAVSVKTLHGSALSAFVAALWQAGNTAFVVITPDDVSCSEITHDLGVLCGIEHVASMLADVRHSAVQTGSTIKHEHVDALQKLQERERLLLVVSAAVLTYNIPSLGDLSTASITLRAGDTVDFDAFVTERLVQGFERTDYVAKPGDIAVRGGIVDIFPGGWDNPVRLEFWGDAIESIREFEPMSQRSIREHREVRFLGRIFHHDDDLVMQAVVDHLPASCVVVLNQAEAIEGELHRLDLDRNVDVLNSHPLLRINSIGDADINMKSQTQPPFAASIEQLLRSFRVLDGRGVEVFLGADGHQNVKRIRELCEAVAEQIEEDNATAAIPLQRALDDVRWVSTTLSSGFIWDDYQLACFTEHQVFARQRAQARARKNSGGISMRELQQLHRGEYVVHADKGIGRFEGLETIQIGGSAQECVRVAFDGGDILYVHLNYIHKLSKFAAEEGSIPKLSKLGSGEWERKKARAKKRIKDIARELIALYARRKAQPGFAFAADTVWQKEFESSFQYEDTPDQARATSDVKNDMELATPMDRLVCGDVGFGKTEVAIRAAFKAAQSGKQVAVLVPTTILAQQHFLTFSDRLHRYPVKIEVLSRFKTKAEQKVILEQLEKGQVDIVIGTHRLLSKDVVFRNLGLLIVDEEHRFGVAAKEKLRSLRVSVDTLTLTATPIPRTLNFSLMGARDLSVIETPPRNRLPITTDILEWDDDVIGQALLRELERGGQAFIVTDRISDIEKLKRRVEMLAPALRVAMAHGQMDATRLEDTMEAFLERKFDVLIATKIIESGLDIPNANTMIIVNADNFGLAELYQLRGRVGRSNIQAFCFLVIPPVHTLSRVSLRRLQALEEFTDLGSGFQLAMRDLEIRGAGNLLGGEQSGFIMEMGFELYQKILEEAVGELHTEEFGELFAGRPTSRAQFANDDVAIELDVDALLPKSYIPADTDRYDAYKRLYNADNDLEVDTVFNELRDRFGALPPEGEELHFAVRLRIAALPLGFVRVNLKESTLLVELPPDSETSYYERAFPHLLAAITAMPNARFAQKGKRLFVHIELGRREDAVTILHQLTEALHANTSSEGLHANSKGLQANSEGLHPFSPNEELQSYSDGEGTSE